MLTIMGSSSASSRASAPPSRWAEVRSGVAVTLGAGLGLFPLGMAFGMLVVQAGLPAWVAPLFSVVVFAGSVELLLVSLVVAGTPLLTIAVTVFLVNFRHVFYAFSFPLGVVRGRLARIYSMGALIDEAYAIAAARQAQEKLKAPSVKPGKYDLVLDPSHTWLTIHESVGHPLELDRVLGYEANYAGTSFATLDKRESGFRWGSDIVNFFADKTQPGSLGAVGYDDEGVPCKRWDLVKDGILVDYQATRDQAHILGKTESDGCSYADAWSSVQFQRMPNVSLAPGKAKLSVSDMIKDVENGIYIIGDGSFSIDQQRYNAQFGGQLFYEIKDGAITGMVEDVAYQIRTPEFWNACSAICDESDFRLGGSFFDGKGQPSQVSAVSHGSSTTRFDGINVINTARSLG